MCTFSVELVLYNSFFNRYNHAIAIKKDFPDAYCDMGVIFHERGLLEQAKVNYQLAIQSSPNDHINARLSLKKIIMEQISHHYAMTDSKKQ